MITDLANFCLYVYTTAQGLRKPRRDTCADASIQTGQVTQAAT